MFRRLLIGLFSLFLQEFPAFQIILSTLSTLCMMIYLLTVRPFDDPFLNKLEIFNEFCVLVSTYHLYLYSDFLSNEDLSL